MIKTKINFSVDKMAVVCNLFDAEIKARMVSKGNPEKKKMYQKYGVISLTPAVTRFMNNHPGIFGNKKFITAKRNIFEEILPVTSEYGKEIYVKETDRRINLLYELSENEKVDLESFLNDLWDLTEDRGVKKIIKDTNKYKDSIEEIWLENEEFVMSVIENTLGGYKPTPKGTVCTYIMYPNFNIHRTCQKGVNQTNLFFGKLKQKNASKIIAYLAHQVVHQPMLPYKTSMTKKEKEKFHAFIKFLTDKDIYNKLTGKSYLDIVTPNENPEIMAKVYPYWLGYKYRNDKDPVSKIRKAIDRDKRYYDRLPDTKTSKKKKLYNQYNFDELIPEKIAEFFKEKRGITPYEFAKIDFDNKDVVTKSKSSKRVNERG